MINYEQKVINFIDSLLLKLSIDVLIINKPGLSAKSGEKSINSNGNRRARHTVKSQKK